MENRPLTAKERYKLHENENQVVKTYERVTKNTFMRYDVIPLKKCIKIATPKQIESQIYRFYKQNPDNFTDFNYLVKPIVQMFKGKRGRNKGDENEGEKKW